MDLEPKKETTNVAIGTLRIISERTLDTDKELCACFTDWQKAVNCLYWTKVMQILKATGDDWGKTRSTSKPYMNQALRYEWTKGRQ